MQWKGEEHEYQEMGRARRRRRVGRVARAVWLLVRRSGNHYQQHQRERCGYTLVNDGKLTVAASLDFPPFENLNGDKPEASRWTS